MKAKSTIRKQIRRLARLAESDTVPEPIRGEAYEAYHALRWVLEPVSWTPAKMLEDEAAEAAAKEKE